MKNVVCVFAHPDDEAFGPGGTIAKLTKKYNVYLLCATKGEVGQKGKTLKTSSLKLGDIRAKELQCSAKVLGIKKVYFLGFTDGTLSNNIYHKLAAKINFHLNRLKPEIVITYEPQGVSGHIDHITTSMVTMFTVQNLKFVKEIWQVCRPESQMRNRPNYFVYFPPGYKKSEIDKVVKTGDVWNKKIEAMMCHQSQIKDIKRLLGMFQKFPKEEYFLVKKIH